MTIKELYEWAKKNDYLECEIPMYMIVTLNFRAQKKLKTRDE